MEQKILIRENAIEATRLVSAVQILLSETNKLLIPAMLEAGVTPNTDIIRDAYVNDCDKAIAIIENQANKDVAKISSPIVKQTLLKHLDEFKTKIRKISREILGYHMIAGNIGLVGYIEIKGNEVVPVDNYEDVIRETAKYYITDDREIEIYQAIKATCDSYNHLLSLLGDKGKQALHIKGIVHLWDQHHQTYEAEPSEQLNYNTIR